MNTVTFTFLLRRQTFLNRSINREGFNGEPIVVRYFYIEGIFDGLPEIILADSHDAIQLVGLVLTSMLILVVIKGVFTFCNDYLMSRVGHKLVCPSSQRIVHEDTFCSFRCA